ncbi:RNA recognition domain-containing protein [Colletotrichum chrysophilum]|uniref:RNA recognition domain-containing protein n=1 Tax=Colletotrichum chrysophilum TaxID=1836956 RepID=A0AAD9AZT3_9PEZI|nr:RNA recognition domain-containing protein [Colletotrichum chrysophilum]
MASRSRSRSPGDRYRSRTRSPTPRSDRGRSASRSPVRRRDYDSRSPSRSQSPAPRRNGRYRSESRSQSPVVRSTKVWLNCTIVVERLTKNINEGHLEEIFSQFGPIKDLDLPINRTYGTNRGTAYILYDHEADAEEAIAHMHEAQIDGAVINVSIVLPRRKLSPPPPMARRGAGYDPRLPAPAGRGSGRQSGAPHAGASGPGSFGQNGPRRGASPPPNRRGPRSDTYRPRSVSRSPSRSPAGAPPSRGGGSRYRSRSRSYSRSRSPAPRRGAGARGNEYRRRSPSRDSYDSYESRRTRSSSRSRDRGPRTGAGGSRGGGGFRGYR